MEPRRYEEVCCQKCYKRIGWRLVTDSPPDIIFCQDCKDEEDLERYS
jgi:hypothetical protein